MPYKDLEKKREAQRRWYKRNSEKHIAHVKSRRLRLRAGMQEYKKTLSCVDCGETHTACLEFHHLDPKTKDGDPSRMYSSRSWSLERWINYLKDTCIVLCANCHRKHHARERLAKKARHTAGKKTRRKAGFII
jgi:L-lactate utilization protein LutB